MIAIEAGVETDLSNEVMLEKYYQEIQGYIEHVLFVVGLLFKEVI